MNEIKKRQKRKNEKSFPNEKFLMLINIAVVSQSLEYPYLMFHYMLEVKLIMGKKSGKEEMAMKKRFLIGKLDVSFEVRHGNGRKSGK